MNLFYCYEDDYNVGDLEGLLVGKKKKKGDCNDSVDGNEKNMMTMMMSKKM